MNSGNFPALLSKAKIIPYCKSGSKLDMGNYRPISLLNCWSKIFEKFLLVRIYNYMEEHKLVYCKQYGFRSKHNTIDKIAEVTGKIRSSKGIIEVPVVLIDFKKAFDTLNHSFLIKKLGYYGLDGPCSTWIKSYISNRVQCVEMNGARSSWAKVHCGVPQGSILHTTIQT